MYEVNLELIGETNGFDKFSTSDSHIKLFQSFG